MKFNNLMLLLALVTVAVCSGCDDKIVNLTENGACAYTLVTPDKMSETDAFVAKDMNSLLARALGRELKVATLSDAPRSRRLFFGIAPKGFDTASLENQERCTVISDGDVYVFGGGTNGNRYAAYDFLQNTLGYRFFDARGGVGVPDLKNLTLTNMTRRTNFAYKCRSGGVGGNFNGPEAGLFFFRVGCNVCYSIQTMQKMNPDLPKTIGFDFVKPWPFDCASECYLPRSPRERRQVLGAGKICGELAKEHPEYFTLNKHGKRDVNEQRCFSNPGLRELLWKVVDQYFAQRPKYAINDISAADRGGRFCWCPGCVALEEKYGTPGGQILDAMLELCEKCKTKHPDQYVSLLAYRKEQTQKPPTNCVTRLPDNFIPVFAPINDNFFQSLAHPSNTNTYRDLEGWCKLSDKVLVWHYVNTYNLIPTPPLGNVERICTDIKLIKKAGAMGACFEHNCGVSEKSGFTELQTYLMYRLFEDVSLDPWTLIREFTDFEYGPAAEGVRRYIAELEKLTQNYRGRANYAPPFIGYGYLTPENLCRWTADFEAMSRLVADDPVRRRNLERLRYNIDHALILMYPRIKKAERKGLIAFDAIERRIREEAEGIVEVCFTSKHDKERKEFLSTLEKKLFQAQIMYSGVSRPLPQELFAGVPADNLFETLPTGRFSKVVEDKDAAFGKAIEWTGQGDYGKMGLPVTVRGYAPLRYRGAELTPIEKPAPGSRGKYVFYPVGETNIESVYSLTIMSGNAFVAGLGNAHIAGMRNRCKIYASLKFQGPKFYPEDKGKHNRVWCDRVVVVRDWDGKK
jgi:hypothetical protein